MAGPFVFGGLMRDWFNAVFAFIGTSSVTDVEWASIDATGITTNTYDQAAYDQMSAILVSREAVSTMQDRLLGVFKAKGADIAGAYTGKTNIFIGAAL